MRCCPTESIRAKIFCADATVSSVTCWIRSSAAFQASALVSRTMTCRRMPKESSRPRLAAAALTRLTLSATCAGGSPQVRYLSTVSTATSMPASEEPPKYNGGRGDCTGGENKGAASPLIFFPGEVVAPPFPSALYKERELRGGS